MSFVCNLCLSGLTCSTIIDVAENSFPPQPSGQSTFVGDSLFQYRITIMIANNIDYQQVRGLVLLRDLRLHIFITDHSSTYQNCDNMCTTALQKVLLLLAWFSRSKTYNLSSTCRGLGIRYPSWSRPPIFLPSIRGYGEPPTKKEQISRVYR